MPNHSLSVIISTYNSESLLEKVLWGYHKQTFKNFELIIADDGSRDQTKELINNFKTKVDFPITHVWQEDHGFQKSKIINKAIRVCNSDYIVMSDGDCIPRKDFLEVHNKHKEKGFFISGGYFKLSSHISNLITKENILDQSCFNLNWLKKNGLKNSFKNNKLSALGYKSSFLNFITTAKSTWNGHNSSGWKKDIIFVNGLDERMQYGGQDREFGERLMNYGIKGKQLRYSAICLHLDHSRDYKTEESIKRNLEIRAYTKRKRVKKTPYGLIKFKDL